MSKNVFITGVAGFIGTNLALFHLKKGDKVFGIDNFISGLPSNIMMLSEKFPDTFYFRRVSLENLYFQDFEELSIRELNLFYHMASPASPPIYQKFWQETILANTHSLMTILQELYENEATGCKFLFASTSEIYGQPLVVPQPESYNGNVRTIGPRSVYDEAKRLGETITYEYYAKYGMDTKIARIHNCYGPYFNIDDGRVIVNFVQQALQNKPITVYGDGSQKRCYTYISDMVRGLNSLVESRYHEPVNLGSSDKYTILQTAEMIRDVTNSSSEIVFSPLPIDDPLDREPVLTRAYEELNWFPVVDFSIGLEKTVRYVKLELEKRKNL